MISRLLHLLALLLVILPAHAAEPDRFVLAISWQPGFCAIARQVPECAERLEDTRFTLHGLWPEPRANVYCGVSTEEEAADRAGNWLDLPRVDLPEDMAARLAVAMPGVRSGLDRHEWIKHGTCYRPRDPVRYYSDSLALLDAVNASGVAALFAGSTGEALETTTIRQAFDAAFGTGAGARVEIVCRRDETGSRIVDLRINLMGTIPDTPLGTLIGAAPARDSRCRGGLVTSVR